MNWQPPARQCDVPDAKQFLHYMTDHKPQGVDAFHHQSLRDVSIGAYLLDPLIGSYPIEKIAGTYASKELPSYQDLFGKTVLEMASMQPSFDVYVCHHAAAALFCGPVIEKQLEEEV